MPLFGRVRKVRTKFLDREIFRVANSRRQYGDVENWGRLETSSREVMDNFPLVFGQHDFIKRRFIEIGRPVVILDWGCGKGTAIEQFAKMYGQQIKAFGYSKDSYADWKNVQNAKIVHATKEDLLRYFKDRSIDFIYSYSALSHLFPEAGNHAASISQAVDYLRALLVKVSPCGKVCFELPSLFKVDVKEGVRGGA